MKSFIILALIAVAAAHDITLYEKDGLVMYSKKLDLVEDPSMYEFIWDNQHLYADLDNFVINGTDARLGEFPYVARVTIVRSTGTGLCSGSMISPRYGLTASHCVNSNPHLITSIGMLMGTVDRSVAGGTTFQMDEFWWMEQPATLVRDIALIRTVASLPTNNPNIGYIRIPSRAQTNFAFNAWDMTLIGWGRDNTGASAIRLQHATFLGVPFSQCTASFREPYEICYIDPESWRMSQPGDSGAPVIIIENGIPTQIGIHAGRRTSGGNTFHSAARVSAFLNWIEELSDIRIRDN